VTGCSLSILPYLNPLYPVDPSLWRASRCERFNAVVDDLVDRLRGELGPRFVIADEQARYAEDLRLDTYLADNPNLAAMD